MKKIIDNTLYNTETAELIADQYTDHENSDYDYLTTKLYRTAKGNYFEYSLQEGTWIKTTESINALTKNEAYTLLVEWDEVELVEKLFPEFIKEG